MFITSVPIGMLNSDNYGLFLLNKQLIKSSEGEDPKIVDTLLKAKANPNVRNAKNLTPLHEAALKGNAVMVSLLVRARANIYSIIPGDPGYSPKTAMSLAIEAQKLNVVETLCGLGYDVNHKS